MDGPPGKIRDRSGGRAGVKCRNAAAPCRQGGGAGHGASRRPRPTGIPAHGTGRPSVPPLQKCRDLSDERRRGRSQTGPRAFARGARIQDISLIRPFGPPYPFCPSGTFPPDRGNRPSPFQGEGLRAAKGRPYGGKRPGSVGSVKPGAPTGPHQPKFLQTQGLVARREFRPAIQILRAGNDDELLRSASPVKGVRGKRPMDLGGTKWSRSPSDASPGAFCPIPRYSRRSPAKRVRREEEEQGNKRSFRRQAETEWSGLCDDEPPRAK